MSQFYSSTSSRRNTTRNNGTLASKSNDDWWEKYLMVLEYKEANGTYDIPYDFNWITDKGGTIKLGQWLAKQKLKLENMDEDRYFALTQLIETGLLWTTDN